MAVAAPVIAAEMADWVALGGGNSGIVGDRSHSYGFHLAANEVPPSDYSRARDPNGANGPYVDWRYACAGDFYHGGDERLRAMHRDVLARLMRGELPMICEFIGQPWSDRPVYYWARWNGIGTLQRYTGAGHDLWSHISWYRSRANERAYLWTPQQAQKGDDMALIVQNLADKKYYVLGADGVPRRLKLPSAKGIADVGWIVSGRAFNASNTPQPGVLPYSNTPTDKEPWIHIPQLLLDVLSVEEPATSVPVDVGKLAAELGKHLPAGGDLRPELVDTLSKARDALDAVVAAAQHG